MQYIAGLPSRMAIGYVAAFAVATLMYTVLWPQAPLLESDSHSYMTAAQDLADLHIDSLQERAPGYPLLLLLTQSSRAPTRPLFIVSLTLHFTSIWLLGTILYRIGRSQVTVGLLCVVLLLPPYVEAAGYVLSEMLAEVILVVAFTFIVRWTQRRRMLWMALAGIAVAAAALTRPSYQLLAVAIASYMCLAVLCRWLAGTPRTIATALTILVASAFLIVEGYALYNYRHFGHFTVTPRLGLTLSTKTFSFFERLPNEYASVRAALIRARDQQLTTKDIRADGPMAIWVAVPELTRITGLSRAELSDYMLKANIVLIREAPLNFAREVAWAFCLYWFPSSGRLANFDSTLAQAVWAAINFVIMGAFALTAIWLAAIAALTVYMKVRAHLLVPWRIADVNLLHCQLFTCGLACTVVMYTALISSLVEIGDPRYRTPTDAMIVFSAFTGFHLWQHFIVLAERMWSGDDTAQVAMQPVP